MRNCVTEGIIILEDDFGIKYRICDIKYTLWEDETFEYLFTPHYRITDMLPSSIFQGIPGLNLDLRKETYSRKNIVPVFISERTPGENRVDLWDLLKAADMDYLNRLEWLIRTKARYSGDKFTVIRKEPDTGPKNVEFGQFDGFIESNLKNLLCDLAFGNTVTGNGFVINDDNRKNAYNLLYPLYSAERKRINGKISKSVTGKAGRRKVNLSTVDIEIAKHRINEGIWTKTQAAEKLGVSRSSFYRRLKESQVF